MNKNSQTYFTTGEVAQLFHIKKQTLFHYDEIGVFSPEIRAENGYRYYSQWQLEVLDVIMILRELDMPLSRIREYLNRRGPDELIRLMEREEHSLDLKIRRLQRMRSLITRKKRITAYAVNAPHRDILLQTREEEFFLATPVQWDPADKQGLQALFDHIRYCEEREIYNSYVIGVTHSPEDIAAGDWERFTHYYSKTEELLKDPAAYQKPAGEYLVCWHKGGYDTVGEAFQRALSYLREHHLKTIGPFYEETLLDALSAHDYNEYLLEISVHIDT